MEVFVAVSRLSAKFDCPVAHQNISFLPTAHDCGSGSYGRFSVVGILFINKSVCLSLSESLGRGGRLNIVPDFNLADSEDQTALELALSTSQLQVAARLLDTGVSIDVKTSEGLALLHKAIMRQDNASALFLLENGADINTRWASLNIDWWCFLEITFVECAAWSYKVQQNSSVIRKTSTTTTYDNVN